MSNQYGIGGESEGKQILSIDIVSQEPHEIRICHNINPPAGCYYYFHGERFWHRNEKI